MKLSVIITVYNRFEYLRNLLLALENQTEKPFEVIVADDGSRESLQDSIADLLPLLSYPLKHVYQEDLGFRAARSRNNGARVASGDTLLFLDQDILPEKEFLAACRFQLKPGTFLKFHPLWFDKDRSGAIIRELKKAFPEYAFKDVVDSRVKLKERLRYRKVILRDKLYLILYKSRLRRVGPMALSLAIGIAKSDYVAVNGFDEKYIGWGREDDDVSLRFYAYGLTAVPCQLRTPLGHMWHGKEQTKTLSLNDPYYYEQREKIFRDKLFRCEYGFENTMGEDVVTCIQLN